MFIKRINWIKEPPCAESKINPSKLSDGLKIYKIASDPHGRYIALYSDPKDKIFILTIGNVLETF